MNHAQLRAFHAVAQNGGFTSAAQALGLTQPALTLQVLALERRYNTKLFNRKGRRIEITSSGAALLRLSTRIFSLEEEAHSLLSSLENLDAGRLKIVAASSLNTLPFVSRFSDKYPAIDLTFHLAEPRKIEEYILDCRFDIGFLQQQPKHSRLFSHKLIEDPVKLAVSHNHPWRSRYSIAPTELKKLKIILSRCEGDATADSNPWFNQFGLCKEKTIVMESKEVGREAVANNMGVAFLSEKEVSGDSRIHLIEIEGKKLTSKNYVTFLNDNKGLRVISSFYRLIKQTLE
ncbi:MAG: LysR substrate-binding domain-containing protein [Proteobacteria bacterium]|nr:LysR substrate-binding domain-containing protein [Pseudomonadota bacterium]